MENQALIAGLVRRTQDGSQEAFDELYQLTRDRAYFVALSVTRNEQDALDIVQDAYLKAWQSIGDLQKPELFTAWLRQITGNTAKTYIKKRKPLMFVSGDDDGAGILNFLPEEDGAYIPDASMDSAETRRLIMEIVEGLPEDQRLCVLMYYYDELPLGEIAEALDAPLGTVKKRLYLARKKISDSVEDLERKHGVKLYGAAPIPLLIWLLKTTAAGGGSAALPPMILGSSAAAAGGTAAGGVAAAAAKASAAVTLPVKIVAGVAATAVIAGGAATAVALRRNPPAAAVSGTAAVTAAVTATGRFGRPATAAQNREVYATLREITPSFADTYQKPPDFQLVDVRYVDPPELGMGSHLYLMTVLFDGDAAPGEYLMTPDEYIFRTEDGRVGKLAVADFGNVPQNVKAAVNDYLADPGETHYIYDISAINRWLRE